MNHIRVLFFSFFWLTALMFAIFPELMMQPIYAAITSQDNSISTTQFFLEWGELFVERKSFYFIPLAVFIDTLIIWFLINKEQALLWLPTKLVSKNNPPVAITIVVTLSTMLCVIGGYMGMDALAMIQEHKETKGMVDYSAVNFYPASIMSLFFVLFFALVAKYCSLIKAGNAPSGYKIEIFDVDRYDDIATS